VVSERITGRGARTTFTTMSATLGLQRMRAQLDSGAAYRAAGITSAQQGISFMAANGMRTVFPAATTLTINRQDDVGRAGLRDSLVLNLALPVLGAGSYAFGSFLSPSWLDANRTIPAVASRRAQPKVRGAERVGLAMIVPSGPKPAGGFAVAIFGPGISRSKFDVFLAADLNAQRGIATVAIDPAGHGFGARSTARVLRVGTPATFGVFGRGRDLDGDGVISDQEGVQAPVQPNRLASIALRDGLRQTALDDMALVRAVGRGVDVDGDGTVDLRRDGVVLYAQSLGGIYGTMLMGVDPRVRTARLAGGIRAVAPRPPARCAASGRRTSSTRWPTATGRCRTRRRSPSCTPATSSTAPRSTATTAP